MERIYTSLKNIDWSKFLHIFFGKNHQKDLDLSGVSRWRIVYTRITWKD